MRIESISYVVDETRKRIKPDAVGKFNILVSVQRQSGFATRSKSLTAMQFVQHPRIKDKDPVITLKTGDKIRVYTGGDPTSFVVQSQSHLELHDEESIPPAPVLKGGSFVIKKQQKKRRQEQTTAPMASPNPFFFDDLDENEDPYDP